MLKISFVLFAKILFLLAAGIGLGMPAAYAQSSDKMGYLVDFSGETVKSTYGLCWRTGFWTQDMAADGCEPSVTYCPEPSRPPEPEPVPVQKREPPVMPQSSDPNWPYSPDVLFDFDKADLLPEGKKAIDIAVTKIGGKRLEVIVVSGHTDRIGDEMYNQKLSEKRAAAIKQYLVEQGIPAERVYAEGKGESQPVTGEECKNLGKENRRNKKLLACLRPDRRIDIEVVALPSN